MADTDCPVCGNRGRLATNYSLDWYKCTACRQKYEVTHTTCAHPSCSSWVDDEESGLCWYHASHAGTHPDGEPYTPDHAREDK